MAAGGDGILYLAGGRINSSNHSEILLLRVDGRLSQFSLTTYPNAHVGEAFASALAIDSAGDIYVTGRSPNAQGGTDAVTLKYTSEFRVEKMADGLLRIRSRTSPEGLLKLEASGDLLVWDTIMTNRADAVGLVTFEGPNSQILPLRFYRTRAD